MLRAAAVHPGAQAPCPHGTARLRGTAPHGPRACQVIRVPTGPRAPQGAPHGRAAHRRVHPTGHRAPRPPRGTAHRAPHGALRTAPPTGHCAPRTPRGTAHRAPHGAPHPRAPRTPWGGGAPRTPWGHCAPHRWGAQVVALGCAVGWLLAQEGHGARSGGPRTLEAERTPGALRTPGARTPHGHRALHLAGHRAPHGCTAHPVGALRTPPVGCAVVRWGARWAGYSRRRGTAHARADRAPSRRSAPPGHCAPTGTRPRAAIPQRAHRAPHEGTAHPTWALRTPPVGCAVVGWGARWAGYSHRRGTAHPRADRAPTGTAHPQAPRAYGHRAHGHRAPTGTAPTGTARPRAPRAHGHRAPTAHPVGALRTPPVRCAVVRWGAQWAGYSRRRARTASMVSASAGVLSGR